MALLNDLWEEFSYLKNTVYLKLRQRQREHSDLYWQKTDIGLDEGRFGKPLWRATPMRIIEAPADHIAMDKIVVSIEPRLGARGLETKQTKEQADTGEQFLQRILDYQRRNEPYFLRELVKNLGWAGEGYLKVECDSEVVRSPEEYVGMPFAISAPNARLIYSNLDMENSIPSEIFEERVVPLSLVKRRLREWNQNPDVIEKVLASFRPKKDSELVSYVEWWLPDQHGFIVGDRQTGNALEAVPIADEFEVENAFGFVPYCRGFSGRGIYPEDGDPASLAVGLLTGIERNIIAQVRLKTKMDTITSQMAAPYPKATLAPGVKLTPEEAKLEIGTVLQVRADRIINWEFLPAPALPPALIQEMAMIDRELDEYLPSITRGEGIPGEPAASVSNRMSAATLIWEPQLIAARRLIAVSLGMCLRIVENTVKAPVDLGHIKLGPDDIQGNYEVSVKIETGNPEQKRWNQLQGNQMVEKLPQRMIIEEFYGYPNATKIMVELLGEKMMNELLFRNPAYQQQVIADVFEKLGLEREGAALAQGQMPEGTQPPQGLVSPQGTGGSPTRGIPPMAGARPPVNPQMDKMRIAEEAMSGAR